MKKILLLPLVLFAFGANAQYNKNAGSNAPQTETRAVTVLDAETGEERVEYKEFERRAVKKVDDATGEEYVEYEEVEMSRDNYGNAAGNEYDLAVDGAFEGQTIVVLHFYTGENFDFSLPKAALAEKGFSVYRFMNAAPEPKELKEALDKACQLWIISDQSSKLNSDHLGIIKNFFDSGKGVYIWGDNQPYYADANKVAQELIGVTMNGNVMGDQTVNISRDSAQAGIRPDHLLSTGIEYIYEGITIATLEANDVLEPLIYGSAGNLVAGVYEQDGKRLILDGGFTRLYVKWDTAGTGRYVKNAAAWLVNYERFGDEVLGDNIE